MKSNVGLKGWLRAAVLMMVVGLSSCMDDGADVAPQVKYNEDQVNESQFEESGGGGSGNVPPKPGTGG